MWIEEQKGAKKSHQKNNRGGLCNISHANN
jgi:hypothetical protein